MEKRGFPCSDIDALAWPCGSARPYRGRAGHHQTSPRAAQTERHGTPSVWAIVLAGGAGVKSRPLVDRVYGDGRPKQYAALLDSRTLLRHTLDRVALLVPPERTVVVTMRDHDRYMAGELRRPVASTRPLAAGGPGHRGRRALAGPLDPRARPTCGSDGVPFPTISSGRAHSWAMLPRSPRSSALDRSGSSCSASSRPTRRPRTAGSSRASASGGQRAVPCTGSSVSRKAIVSGG